MNIDGLLHVELTRVGEESTIGKIITLMREAENAKPPVTRLLDRYAGQYMAVVLLVAGRRLAHQRQRARDARGARRVVPVRARARGARDGRRGDRSRGAPRHPDQGLRLPRAPRGRLVRDLRQDRHDHDRRPATGGDAAGARRVRRRAAARRGEPRRDEQPSAEPRGVDAPCPPPSASSSRTRASSAASASPRPTRQRHRRARPRGPVREARRRGARGTELQRPDRGREQRRPVSRLAVVPRSSCAAARPRPCAI